MSAVVPRKFIPHQLRFAFDKGQLLAQVVRLSHPWDTLGHVLASASADPSSHTVQAPLGATTPLTPLPDQPGERLAQQLSPPQQAQPQQPLEQTSHDHLLPGATLRPSQQPQQPQLQHSKHSARSKPSSSSPFGLAGVIPPGQLHAITQAQLRKLQPQFIRQSELSACSSMGQRLSRSLLKEQQGEQQGAIIVQCDVPHCLAKDQRLQAVLSSIDGRKIRIVRSVVKAKVLQHS